MSETPDRLERSPGAIENQSGYLVADVGATSLGFPVDGITEVLRPSGLARVPWAPSWTWGVASHHGRIYTLIDLARLAEVPDPPQPQVALLVDRPDLQLGIGVASVQVVEERAAVKLTDLRYHLPDASWIMESLSTTELSFHRLDLERVVASVLERF